MKLTGYGKREWLGGGIVAITFIAIFIICTRYNQALFISFASLTGVVYICIASFFRDPNRKIPAESNVLLSPVDGTVSDIELIKDMEANQYFEGKDAVRIGIYISLFDVRIKRAPCDLKIEDKFLCKDCFCEAEKSEDSQDYGASAISCKASVNDIDFPLILRMSGVKSGKNICKAEPEKSLSKGEKFGMIKSGSRVEIYLPAATWVQLTVKLNDKLQAGATKIAKVTEQDKKKK